MVINIKDVSIVFSASDKLTQSIKTMKTSVQGLSRDVTEYRKIQSDAFDKKTEVKLDISKAKKELKELEKAVKDEKDGSAKAFKEKAKQLEELQEEYKRLGQVAKDASKAERQLQEDISRSSNKNASRIGSQKGLAGSLAQAGLYNMVGQSLTNNLSYNMTSMFGNETGSAIASIGGNAVTGAAMGSVAGPLGSLIGGSIGLLTGAINNMTEKQKKTDDLFRDEVQNLYAKVKQDQEQSLNGGINSSSALEQNMISFGTLLNGRDNASKFLSDVQQFSAKTPFEMDNLLRTSKTMLSYGYGQDEILPLMNKVGDAGSALGMDAESINWVATSIGRMKSSGKTTLEYLNPLIERGIPAIDYLAKSLNKSKGDVYEMVSKGLIPGAEAAKVIADSMGEQFAGSMEQQSKTYAGLMSTLKDTWTQIDKSMGEGYTEERKKGMEQEIEQLTGTMGEKMKEAYNLIGQYKADLENEYQQSIIDAMSTVQNSDEYKKAQQENNGAEMGRILAEARANAEIEYKNSEGYQLQQKADLALVKGLQADVAIKEQYLEYGKLMAEQFSIGYSGGIKEAQQNGMLDAEQEQEVIYNKGSWLQQIGQSFKDLNNAKAEGQGKYAEAKSNNYQTTNKTESNVTQHINMTFNNMENKDPKSFMREMTKELEKAKQNIARNSHLSIN